MLKKNIFTKVIILAALILPVTSFAQVFFPSTAFAQAVATGGNFFAYIAANWIDIPFILIICAAAYFAIRSALLYGGVIGHALKFISTGLVLLAAEEILGFILLDEVAFNNSYWSSIADIVQLVGAILIAVGLFRLYTQSKKQLQPSDKK